MRAVRGRAHRIPDSVGAPHPAVGDSDHALAAARRVPGRAGEGPLRRLDAHPPLRAARARRGDAGPRGLRASVRNPGTAGPSARVRRQLEEISPGDLRLSRRGDRRDLRGRQAYRGPLEPRPYDPPLVPTRPPRRGQHRALSAAAATATASCPSSCWTTTTAATRASARRACGSCARASRSSSERCRGVGGRLIVRPRARRARAAGPARRDRRATRSTPTPRSDPIRSGATGEAAAAVEAAGARWRPLRRRAPGRAGRAGDGRGDPYTVFTPFSRKWMAAEKRAPEPAPAALDTPNLPSVPPPGRCGLARPRDGPAASAGRRAGSASAASPILRRRAVALRRGPRPAGPRGDLAPVARTCTSGRSRLGRCAPRRGGLAERRPGRAASRRPPLRPRARLARVLPPRALPLPARRAGELSARARPPRVAADDPDPLDAWKRGRTGYPLVDAAMRQLASIALDAQPRAHGRRLVPDQGPPRALEARRGVVHARPRGRRPGQQQRRMAVDGGHGTDAAPYFRDLFNPSSSPKRFDPDGRSTSAASCPSSRASRTSASTSPGP